jgi:GNAT superfamily N-acetyltransferase
MQRRASLHWDAYREQRLAHPDAVELPLDQITDGLVRVAELDADVVGFAGLLRPSRGACELDGLFVEPGRMGAGVGRALIEDATRIARERGAVRTEVVANPEAVGFYRRVGFTGAAQVPTRFGPARRMRLTLLSASLRAAPPAACSSAHVSGQMSATKHERPVVAVV